MQNNCNLYIRTLPATDQKTAKFVTSTSVHTYRHTSTRRAIFHEMRICSVNVYGGGKDTYPRQYFPVVSDWSDFGLLWEQSCYSLPRTPVNHGEKLDAASFILAGVIRNRTNAHTHTKQTVTDISTPCLTACVDKNVILPIIRQFRGHYILLMMHSHGPRLWNSLSTHVRQRELTLDI